MKRLLDLFCCQGGAAMGYHRAGFEVVGVDIVPQPRYPFPFIQADALEFLRGGCYWTASDGLKYGMNDFDVIHASPPCQHYSEQTAKKYRGNHPDLIAATREAINKWSIPYVIENVEGAKRLLKNPMMLCGTMFGLNIWRHRFFEISETINALLPPCKHDGYPVLITGTTRRTPKNGGRFEYSKEQCASAIGIDWMTREGLDESVPPVFTEYIGRHLMQVLEVTA